MSLDHGKQVQFHLDRSYEASIRIIQSIITNPVLTDSDRFTLLVNIASHHERISAEVTEALMAGRAKAVDIAASAKRSR